MPPKGWTTETLERGFLHREVSFETEVGGRRVRVAEPQGDDGDVVAREQQAHGRGVSERVHGDVFCPQGWASVCRGGQVEGEASLDGVAAEAPAGDGREQGVGGLSGALAEPGLEDGSRGWHQRCVPFLAAFADGVDVGPGAERDVLAGETGQLGDPQARLDCKHQQGVVAPACGCRG